MDDFASVNGPVERVGASLFLRIPMSVGGEQLAGPAGSAGRIEDGFLVVEIRDWLADKLGIAEGSIVDVDNLDGKFNIRPRQPSG